MNRRLVAWYASLLACLPSEFGVEFAAEMEQVFADRVQEMDAYGRGAMIHLFAAELLALPGLWLLAHRRERRILSMDNSPRDTASESQASWAEPQASWGEPQASWGEPQAFWGATLAAILPLVAFVVLVFVSGPLQHLVRTVDAALLNGLYRLLWTDAMRGAQLPVVFFVLLLGGLLFAWLKDFPRWSYPYLGWLLVILIAGIDAPRPGDPFPWLAWGPFLLTMLLAILLRPSIEPLRALARGWRRDWTLSAFAVLGIVQFLVWASFDGLPGRSEPWQLVSMAVLVAGALGYMRAPGRFVRVTALLGSALLSISLSVAVYPAYWNGVQKANMNVPADGLALDTSSMMAWAMLLAILMVPALLSATLNRFFPSRPTQ